MAITVLEIYNDALSLAGSRRLAAITDDVEQQRIITEIYNDCRDFVLSEHAWTFAQKRATLIDMTTPDVDLWETDESYAVDDEVSYGGVFYTCLVAHTSDTFSGDLTSVYWETTLDWVTDTAYAIGDQVYESGISYTCLEAHTSGTFATDLTSVYWIASEVLEFDEDGMSVIYYRPTDYIEVTLFSNVNAVTKVEETRILSNVTGLKIKYTYQHDVPATYTAQFRKCLAAYIAAKVCFSLIGSASKAKALLEEYTTIVLPKAISRDSKQGSPREVRADEWEISRISGAGAAPPRAGQETWHPTS